jgi:hypothetical protein
MQMNMWKTGSQLTREAHPPKPQQETEDGNSVDNSNKLGPVLQIGYFYEDGHKINTLAFFSGFRYRFRYQVSVGKVRGKHSANVW